MHSIEIDHFLCQPKTILSEPSSIQAHQSSNTQPNTSLTLANIFGDKTTMYCMFPSRKREQNICYVFISPFPSKRKTVFYNITHKPAVTHILKTLLKHDFHEVKILILYFFVEKFVSFYLGLTNA